MRKDGSLEFLRGVAAIVVLFSHTLAAFAPSASGIFSNHPTDSLQTSFAFVAFNGPSAVYLFFVLSSYVLVKRYFTTRKKEDLLLGAAKRLPRLAGPVLVTVLASCVIFKLDLYFFREAAAITGSPWLANFGFALKVLSSDTASFSEAFMQGVWRTFIFGDSHYDSSLWTMKFEFWGSLMTFALAPIVFFLLDRSVLLSWCAIAVGIFLAWQVDFIFIAFTLGLSLYLLITWKFRLNAWARTAVVAVSLALLGYAGHAVGVYRPFAILEFDGLPVNMRQSYVAVLASVMLVYAVLTMENTPAWLSGKGARFLGDLSFPLYLVHVPVICSLGSWAFLASGSAAFGAAASIAASIAVALPLMIFNNWWVAVLGGLFNRFRRRGVIVAAPEAARI